MKKANLEEANKLVKYIDRIEGKIKAWAQIDVNVEVKTSRGYSLVQGLDEETDNLPDHIAHTVKTLVLYELNERLTMFNRQLELLD